MVELLYKECEVRLFIFIYLYWPFLNATFHGHIGRADHRLNFNLVHTYKIQFGKSFVLCVVFKYQYFWSYWRKTHILPFIYIFQRAITHSKIVWLTRYFFYRLRTFQFSFFCFCCCLSLITFLKSWSENVKKLNFVAAISDFWRPSWIDNEEFLTLYSIHDNDHLYQFW